MTITNSLKIANQLFHAGKLDDSRREYEKIIELNPNFSWNYYYLGKLFFQEEKWSDAIAQYRQAIKFNPNSANFHNSLAEALIKEGKLDKAINSSQKAISLQPNSAIYHQTLALVYEAKSNFGLALTTWQKILSFNSNHLKATQKISWLQTDIAKNCVQKGDKLNKEGKIREAVEFYQQALILNPQQPMPIYRNCGNNLITLSRFQEAERVFQELIKVYPKLPDGYHGYARLTHSLANWNLALERWSNAIEKFPENINFQVQKGNALINLSRFDEAEDIFKRLIEKFPNQPHGYEGYARLNHNLADWNLALERWSNAIEKFPENINFQVQKGNVLINLSRFDEAEDIFKRLIEKFPNQHHGYEGYARLTHNLADWNLALERWSNAINNLPHYFNFYVQKGNVLLNLGRCAEAEIIFNQLAIKFPYKLQAKDGLARILTTIQDWENAANTWQEIIERFPQHKPAYLQLAKTLTQLGKLELAETVLTSHLSLFQQVIQSHPQAASSYLHLGNALKSKSWTLLPEAITAYRQAIKLNPQSHNFYLTLAGALVANYQFEEAEKIYRQAIALNPKLVGAYTGLAGLLSRIGKVEEAIVLLKESISINIHPNLYSTLANLIVESKGNLSEAEIYYKKAITLKPSIERSPGYAQFLSKQNRLREALNSYWELHTKNYQRFNLTKLWKGINDNPSKSDKKYIILGSSHSGLFIQKYENLDVVVYSIPAASVAGFGKRESTLNTSNLVRHIVESKSFDKFIFKLGQVDIEYGYYYKLIMKGENVKFEDFAQNIASIYFDFLTSLEVEIEKLVVFGANLPSIFVHRNAVKNVVNIITDRIINPNNSKSIDTIINQIVAQLTNVLPPIVERTKRSLKFNEILKGFCQEYQITYRDFTEETLDLNTGILKLDFVDKSPENCDHHLMFCPATVKLYADKLLTVSNWH
ncbi:tetratricopeptide repeat protein [Okeania sp.]|uniref:tetratricopeptide repeat protein n=1 Tax=Okeania sp. TaxID=3100323 RepID=UPI002B4B7F24|nr:tetratricopeptide repeat protein [Okeania sp.]MEB3339385.1 tetratricopeptide repeat protein [Okeania sp.]